MTQSELKKIISYDPETGFLKWINPHSKLYSKPQNVSDGSVGRKGYIVFGIKGKRYKAHRLAWLYMTGSFPQNEIDHINGNTSDNRWVNLRDVTSQENRFNNKAPKGYYLEAGKYRAQIRVKNKYIFLGYHETKEQARKAYIDAKIKYQGKEFCARVLA